MWRAGAFPAIRSAEASTVVVADSFSCSTQIADADVGRQALHLSEVLALTHRHGGRQLQSRRPEELVEVPRPAPSLSRRLVRTVVPLAAGAALVAGAVRRQAEPG